MGRSLFVIVSDDYNEIQRARAWGQQNGVTVNAYSSAQWTNGLEDPAFRSQIHTEEVNLSAGHNQGGAQILPFPGTKATGDKKVSTINDVEKHAIETAIFEFRGNLTEAAKALGIGRATLYRKVKQYGIDPSVARRKNNRVA